MKKKILIILAFLLPVLSSAQTQQQGGGIWQNGYCQGDECQFGHLILLIEDVINFLIIIAIPISAIVFAIGGFKIMTSGDNAGKRAEAKTMMVKVAIGLVVMLAAGLIVNTITAGLGLRPGFSLINTGS